MKTSFWYRTLSGAESLVISTENKGACGHPIFSVLVGLILESQRCGLLPVPLTFTDFVKLVRTWHPVKYEPEQKIHLLNRLMGAMEAAGLHMEVEDGMNQELDCLVIPYDESGFVEDVFDLKVE